LLNAFEGLGVVERLFVQIRDKCIHETQQGALFLIFGESSILCLELVSGFVSGSLHDIPFVALDIEQSIGLPSGTQRDTRLLFFLMKWSLIKPKLYRGFERGIAAALMR
jgi:hypothetical protein